MSSLAALLLAGASVLGTGVTPSSPDTLCVSTLDETPSDVTDLMAGYELALTAWQEKLDATEDRAEKRALKKDHPAEAIADQMAGFAREGQLEAARWCLENLRELGFKRKAREALRIELYGVLVEAKDAATRSWVLEELLGDSRLSRAVGLEAVEALALRLIAVETEPFRQGHARALLGQKLARSRDARESERGLSMLRALHADESSLDADDHEWVAALLFKLDFLSVGKTAPAFDGRSVDGKPIALADFHGKVTVLSFFGFW
jgi:hypothetical protein